MRLSPYATVEVEIDDSTGNGWRSVGKTQVAKDGTFALGVPIDQQNWRQPGQGEIVVAVTTRDGVSYIYENFAVEP